MKKKILADFQICISVPLNNFNKTAVDVFSLLHHQYNKSLKFAVLKDVNCSVLIIQFIYITEIVQLQESNKDLRIPKAGANMITTPKPQRFWSGFGLVFCIWHLEWFFMNILDLVFKIILFPISAKIEVLHPTCSCLIYIAVSKQRLTSILYRLSYCPSKIRNIF